MTAPSTALLDPPQTSYVSDDCQDGDPELLESLPLGWTHRPPEYVSDAI